MLWRSGDRNPMGLEVGWSRLDPGGRVILQHRSFNSITVASTWEASLSYSIPSLPLKKGMDDNKPFDVKGPEILTHSPQSDDMNNIATRALPCDETSQGIGLEPRGSGGTISKNSSFLIDNLSHYLLQS